MESTQKTIRKYVFTGIILSLLMSSCYTYMDHSRISTKRKKSPALTNWNMPGGNYLRYNYTAEEPRLPLKRKFRAKHESIVVEQPLLNFSVLQLMLASGKAFFYTYDSLKYVGDQKPTYGMEHGGMIYNKHSYYPNVLGNFAVKAMNFEGEISEKSYGQHPVSGGILIKDKTLLFAENGINLTALFINTYKYKWTYRLHDKLRSNPVLSGDTLYLSDISGTIYALDWSSGTLIWEKNLHITLANNPLVLKKEIFLFSKEGVWAVLDRANGDLLWEERNAATIVAPPAFNGKNIYVASTDHNLYCFNPVTRRIDWHFSTNGVITSQPFCAGQYIIIGSWDKKLYIVNKEGRSVFTDTLTKPVKSSPLFSNGRLYVNASNYGTYAYE